MTDELVSNFAWANQLQTRGHQSFTVTVKVDPTSVSNVTQRLEPYKSLPEKFRPALEALADYYTSTSIPKVFKEEGPGWAPLAIRTQMERRAAGYNPKHPILRRSGDLFKELTERAHPSHVEVIRVGTTSSITIGGSSDKFIHNQLGNSQLNLPARPMLPGVGGVPLPSQDVTAMKQVLIDAIQKVIASDAK